MWTEQNNQGHSRQVKIYLSCKRKGGNPLLNKYLCLQKEKHPADSGEKIGCKIFFLRSFQAQIHTAR